MPVHEWEEGRGLGPRTTRARRNPSQACLVLAVASTIAGCSGTTPALLHVDRGIHTRVGHGIIRGDDGVAARLPPDVALDDGITEGEAVALALWNNAPFRADLADLGVAEADLVESGLLRNPVLSVLFPVGPKQLEASVSWGVEVLWERPRRMAVARLQIERIAERLVANGLDAVRAARVAHADLVLAGELARLAADVVELEDEATALVAARLRAGDESPFTMADAQLALVRARDEAARLGREVDAAAARLREILGLDQGSPIPVVAAPLADRPTPAASALLEDALAARPDVRAAEIRVDEAAARIDWEETQVLRAAALLDLNARGAGGPEAGPGLEIELPLFNRNQAGVARGEAELERAVWQYVAVRRQVAREVDEARSAYVVARTAHAVWRDEAGPLTSERLALAEEACAAGVGSYLGVLESRRESLRARRSELEAAARRRRASADLDRSVGRRLDVQ